MKSDIWQESFDKFLSHPKTINPYQLNKNLKNLTLERYYIYNLDLQINIFDFLGTIIRIIWAHHYLQHFHGTPFGPEKITKKITTEIWKLSDMNNFDK